MHQNGASNEGARSRLDRGMNGGAVRGQQIGEVGAGGSKSKGCRRFRKLPAPTALAHVRRTSAQTSFIVRVQLLSTTTRAVKAGKAILGFLLVAFGYLILAGLDRNLEAFLVDISPMWLTQLATRF